MIFIFDCSSPFCFLLIEFHYVFFHLLYSDNMLGLLLLYLTRFCYVNTLFPCFFTRVLIFSPMGSVTGCDSSLGSFGYSRVYFL